MRRLGAFLFLLALGTASVEMPGQIQPQQPEVACEPTAWPWCYGEGDSGFGNFCKTERTSVWLGYGYVDFCRHCCPESGGGYSCGSVYAC